MTPASPTSPALRVLALEPYYGGSHRAFLDGWARRSTHAVEVFGLPAHRWKWRMRHGALTLADQLRAEHDAGRRFDRVFVSDMLDLATWRGLIPPTMARLPTVAYFHENQLTYPVRVEAERDLHFAFTNITTALAADEVWWSSAFHRDDFLAAVDRLWQRLPDHQPWDASARIRARSRVLPQAIDLAAGEPGRQAPRRPGPLHLVWAARWEHDKNPEAFFDALDHLVDAGVPFRVSVLGQSFRQVPACFAVARQRLGERVSHWGWLENRRDYLDLLSLADVFVSTADHEFFGVAAAEAMGHGCRPLLPARLAYPELLEPLASDLRAEFLYADGTLADRLLALARRVDGGGSPWPSEEARRAVAEAMGRFGWSVLAPRLDRAIEGVGPRGGSALPGAAKLDPGPVSAGP